VSRRAAQATTDVPRRIKGRGGDSYALRGHILRKAAAIFGKNGAADTTVEDILQAADVSRRTFYRFFESKEDVLDALHEIGCNMILGAARQATSAAGTPLERLARAIEAYLEYYVTTDAGVMAVVQAEAMRAGSRLAPRRRAFLDAMVDLFATRFEKARGFRVDPLLLRGLLVSLESVALMMRTESGDGQLSLERAKCIMLRIALATVAGQGDGIPPLPRSPGTGDSR
jgi:AcrR family transcriptional regulator